jgi:flagellar L-ring protein precursor FlgH
MSRRSIIIATTTIGLGGPVLAQSAPPQEHQRSVQAVMQGSGGSLLQASPPAAAPSGASAGPNTKTPPYSLYAVGEPEPKVLRKHDLVNIVVQETSNFTATGDSNQVRDSNLDAKVDQFVSFNPSSFSLHGTGQATNPVEVKLEGERDFKGTAAVDRSDTVTLRLEAEVIDVKPNGTLVLQSKKHIKTDEEEETIILSGVCRVTDIDATNSVLSTDLQDLDLQKITVGAIHDTTKRGYLHRLLDFINPF